MASLGGHALPGAVAAALSRFRGELAARFGERLREVKLFGSWARGDAHEESDVDVLVVVDDLTEAERRDVMDLSYEVAHALASDDDDTWVSISPLPYSAIQAAAMRAGERRLFRDIDREGVAL